MWLQTTIGFFSIVQKPSDEATDSWTIRARAREDLERLQQQCLPTLGEITADEGTDYRFRAVADKSATLEGMVKLVSSIDYSNFKNAVAHASGSRRASLYHDVWETLYHIQTDSGLKTSKPYKADSFGVVLVSGGGQLLLRAPKNQFGGYAWTFAKTRVKKGESGREAALRAAREKTGYSARIRLSLPRLFASSNSVTQFYLADANEQSDSPNWQTEDVRWVTFDEARELLRTSPLQEACERDLAILDAAEMAWKWLPYNNGFAAQPEDWDRYNKLQPMPRERVTLYPRQWYSAEDMNNIRLGHVPQQMEEKWFAVLTGSRLRFYRSWSGILIYDAGLEFDPEGGAYLTELIVNRDREQYGNDDNDEDLALFLSLVKQWLIQRPNLAGAHGVESMFQALAAAEPKTTSNQPQSLLDEQAVGVLTDPLFAACINPGYFSESTDHCQPQETDIATAIAEVVRAFNGDSPYWLSMPAWHNGDVLGRVLRTYVLCNPDDAQTEFTDIVRTSLECVVLTIAENLKACFQDDAANLDEDFMPAMRRLKQFLNDVFLGRNTVTHPTKTLADFVWAKV